MPPSNVSSRRDKPQILWRPRITAQLQGHIRLVVGGDLVRIYTARFVLCYYVPAPAKHDWYVCFTADVDTMGAPGTLWAPGGPNFVCAVMFQILALRLVQTGLTTS